MNLSLYTGAVKPYLEYGWVCAPNAAGQSIAANTITTLYLSSEIADTRNFGSLSSGTFPSGSASATSQITLAAGSYQFLASTRFVCSSITSACILSLYNFSDSTYVSRSGNVSGPSVTWALTTGNTFDIRSADIVPTIEGQFTISGTKIFTLQLVTGAASTIQNGSGITNSTAGADQRTTIKLWKLA